MLIDEGDSILIEKPTYVGALSYLRPLNVKFIGKYIYIIFTILLLLLLFYYLTI